MTRGMLRACGFSLVVGVALLAATFRCYWTCHEPRRHPMGGFLCGRCGLTGARLSDLGFDLDGDYVRVEGITSGEAGRA